MGTSWRVDETYIKIRGKWRYLYHSVDKEGHTVDFLLSDRRDIAAAKLPAVLTVRMNRYLNNVVEQDHRRVKQRVRPMPGFKRFAHATITLAGIELVHQIQKKQFADSVLGSPEARTPQVWAAALDDLRGLSV